MARQFSNEGKYFAEISSEGKLKVWETATSTLQQEFTPDFHLTTPCTCLQFVEPDTSSNRNGSPRKKIKRRSSVALESPIIALGTTSGSLFAYSIAKGDLEYTIDSNTNQHISCISWREQEQLFTGADQNIICWDLEKRSVKSKWKAGNEKITAILALQKNAKLLTASKNIKLWDVKKKELLKTFTGHSYEVSLLHYVNPKSNGEYFLSGSKGDRILSCWNLDITQSDVNSVVTFHMEDIPYEISTVFDEDNTTHMAVTIRSGVVHIYRHTLNGKCPKPLKPKTTVQVASDTGQNKTVTPIPIASAIYQEDLSLLIAHGNAFILTFENMTLNKYEKIQCLIRKEPTRVSSKENQVSKIKAPLVGESVQYLTPHTTAAVATKRKGESSGKMDIPMEKRLENLTLSKHDGEGKVRVDNVAQLLIQGIHSKDKNILRSALSRRDENVIRNSVKRLPVQVIEPLVQELTSFIQAKTNMGVYGALWLRIILQMHAGILISRPDLAELLGPIAASIESRLSLHTPLKRMQGRLEMIMSQISGPEADQSIESEPMLVFNDTADDNDSGAEGLDILQSDNEWIDGEDEDELEEIDGDEMSVEGDSSGEEVNHKDDGSDEEDSD